MERGEVEVYAEPWQYLLPLGGANSPQLISLYSTNVPITVARKCLIRKSPEEKETAMLENLQLLQTILCPWKPSALSVSGGLHVSKASNWKAIFGSLLLSEPKVM